MRGLVLLAVAALSVFSGRICLADQAIEVAPVGKKFDGKVELNAVQVAVGETVIQILDRDRNIVCYGKFSQGGASTISCQKFK